MNNTLQNIMREKIRMIQLNKYYYDIVDGLPLPQNDLVDEKGKLLDKENDDTDDNDDDEVD